MFFRVSRIKPLYNPHAWTSQWACRVFSSSRPTRIDDIDVGTPVKPEVKPYYVTTPIFYVNAGEYPMSSRLLLVVSTQTLPYAAIPQLLTSATFTPSSLPMS
jgi:hypothetical protein